MGNGIILSSRLNSLESSTRVLLNVVCDSKLQMPRTFRLIKPGGR